MQDKVHQASQQVIEKTAENLLTLEKNVKRNVKKNLVRVAASLDEVIYQDIIINKQLRTILALLKTQSKAAKGYSAESKANLREAMLLMREHLDASDQTIAEELNRDSIPTLTGQGEWTALKVKRFLASEKVIHISIARPISHGRALRRSDEFFEEKTAILARQKFLRKRHASHC